MAVAGSIVRANLRGYLFLFVLVDVVRVGCQGENERAVTEPLAHLQLVLTGAQVYGGGQGVALVAQAHGPSPRALQAGCR